MADGNRTIIGIFVGLLVVVVAVVAAALAVFVLVRSNRMEPQVAEVRPEQQVQVDQPQDSGTRSWPAPDTTMARERPEVAEVVRECPSDCHCNRCGANARCIILKGNWLQCQNCGYERKA